MGIIAGSPFLVLDARAASDPASSSLPPIGPPPAAAGRGALVPAPIPMDAPFGTNVRVSDAQGNQNEIAMAVASDGRIHMGWNDNRLPNPDYRCGYSYSTDGGDTWSANRLFHLPPWDADGDPVVVVDSSDAVYFVCMAFSRTGGGSRITVYKSTDGGATFAPPTIASDTTSGLNDKPWAHVVGTAIHLCYANFGISPNELRYTRSTDGGATWVPTQVLGRNGNGCQFASDDAGNLYMSWRAGSIVVRRSRDGGATWDPIRTIASVSWTPLPGPRAYTIPSMASDRKSGAVYIVWHDDDAVGGYDVRFSRSTDSGLTWSAPQTLNDDSTGRQYMPAMGVGPGGSLSVAWYDTRTGLAAVRSAYSTDGGATWSANLRVTDTEFSDSTPFIGDYIALVADAFGSVNVGWCDVRSGDNDAYFARMDGPRLARIDVSPPTASTDADTPVSFAAEGFDQYGRAHPVSPGWQATGGAMAGSTYVPALSGDWTVWANESGVSGSAAVHVSPGALSRIGVAPANATITADDTQPYTATGYDAQGNGFALSPAWSVSDGSITPGGVFTPQHVGSWTVYANDSGVSGSTSVTVVPGQLAVITVTPANVTIDATTNQPYTAEGSDAKGNAVAIAPLWEATGGSIDASGLYVPVRAGQWSVWANESGVSGTTGVLVLPGPLAWIEVSPKDLVVTADQTVPYTAVGYDAKGNEVPILPVWSAAAGTIDGLGIYTPGPVGTYTIAATVGPIAGSTTITVRPGPLVRIDVTPSPVTITADTLLPLTANGYDVRDNRVAIVPTWAATCGSVDSSGVYAPGPARLCVVFANESGISGNAQVTVLPGRLARIDVSPPSATIPADDTQPFTATGWDAQGNEVPITPTWSVSEGTIDGAGLYIPRAVGSWQVAATVSPVVGTATVTVTPGALTAIDVLPPTATIPADDTQLFTARGRDAHGNEIPLSVVSWSAEDGTIAGGLFTPVHVGAWTVSASQGGVAGNARVTVTPGAVVRVEITPGSANVGSGGSVSFHATAYDAKGNEVPDARFAWGVEGGVGTIDPSGSFRATRGGSGTVVATSGGARATATVLVDAGFAPFLPWVGAFLLVALLLALVAWRRRRRGPPRPGD